MTEETQPWTELDSLEQLRGWSAAAIQSSCGAISIELDILRGTEHKLSYDLRYKERDTTENLERVRQNKQLPYLVATVTEIVDLEDADQKTTDFKDVNHKNGKCAIIRTSSRQTILLPVGGLVDIEELDTKTLVGVNKDSYVIYEKLPDQYDPRVKTMEVVEKPQDSYSDLGGINKQIEELIEAIVLPITHREAFRKIGIQPPRGVLLYGNPGTGKTKLARACAASTDATFLKLAGPQLVQMFIGDGSKIVRDAFALAKAKAPNEIDAIGGKRNLGGELSGIREVQRTMLELLNQLDGFSSNEDVRIIGSTNRPEALDPALLRSGRLDRKIELPWPDQEGRATILKIHSRKMVIDKDNINFDDIAAATPDFSGAQLAAVCIEAGLEALRRDASYIKEADYYKGISEVIA